MISIPKAFASMFEPACARSTRIWGMFERPLPALCKSIIASESSIKYLQTWWATLRVEDPLGFPGKFRFKSLPSGKYLDFDLYPGILTTGTIRIVPAKVSGFNGLSFSVNEFPSRWVQADGPVNSSPCIPPRIVIVGPGLLPWIIVTGVAHGSPKLTSNKGRSIVRIVPRLIVFR